MVRCYLLARLYVSSAGSWELEAAEHVCSSWQAANNNCSTAATCRMSVMKLARMHDMPLNLPQCELALQGWMHSLRLLLAALHHLVAGSLLA